MEPIKEKAILYLDYIFKGIQPAFSKIKIDDKLYILEEVDKKNIEIKFSDIEEELGSKNIQITFKYEDIDETIYCEIIPGINIGIIFPYNGSLRDLVFSDDQTHRAVFTFSKKNEEHNIQNKRLLLLNYSKVYSLSIDGIVISSQIAQISQKNSVQICVADLDKRLFFEREISPINYNEFFEKYDELNSKAKYIYDQIIKLTKSNFFNYDIYNSYFNIKELENILFMKFNLPKKILSDKYNKKEYFDFISYCSLYYILSPIQGEKSRELTEIKKIVDRFISFKSELENDQNLEYYMKNMIMIEFSCVMGTKENFDVL